MNNKWWAAYIVVVVILMAVAVGRAAAAYADCRASGRSAGTCTLHLSYWMSKRMWGY